MQLNENDCFNEILPLSGVSVNCIAIYVVIKIILYCCRTWKNRSHKDKQLHQQRSKTLLQHQNWTECSFLFCASFVGTHWEGTQRNISRLGSTQESWRQYRHWTERRTVPTPWRWWLRMDVSNASSYHMNQYQTNI